MKPRKPINPPRTRIGRHEGWVLVEAYRREQLVGPVNQWFEYEDFEHETGYIEQRRRLVNPQKLFKADIYGYLRGYMKEQGTWGCHYDTSTSCHLYVTVSNVLRGLIRKGLIEPGYTRDWDFSAVLTDTGRREARKRLNLNSKHCCPK